MLRGELLSEEGLTALSSSWPFLLGTTWTVLGLSCTDAVVQRFEKLGAQAFDAKYLHLHWNDSWNSIVSRNTSTSSEKSDSNEMTVLNGATEFFFSTCWLLRSSLYPLLRVENEFHQRNRQVLALVQDRANHPDQQALPAHLQEVAASAVSTWFGLDAFFQNVEFASLMTRFALLQLRWVHAALPTQHAIPDWMAKEPARWLARVAQQQQQHKLLKPWHAEQAVTITTQLLSIGSQNEKSAFSPLVLTELIRVAAAFVRTGVSKARRKENRRSRRRGFGDQPQPLQSDEIVDERSLDTYLSFDASDLGVAVFTNQRVCKELCPTLLQTFRALDIVEGLDVDREASFDKFSVKVEIADLLLRLWGHPNGECRASILRQPAKEMASFASSVAAAIGYLLDDACQRFADVTKAAKRRSVPVVSRRDQAFIEAQTKGAVSGFMCARRLLLLLCRFSIEPAFASAIAKDPVTSADMAAMVVHFLDILTSPEGGTNADLDLMALTPESSKSLGSREASMSAFERRSAASSLVAARTKGRKEFGLDVSILSHQLLGLAARWCYPDVEAKNASVTWLRALANQEDCDVLRYKAILDRLIRLPERASANAALLVFQHDGYVDPSVWVNQDTATAELTDNQKQWRRTAAQEQMNHSEIDAVANHRKIATFLDTLAAQKSPAETRLKDDDVKRLQDEIMTEESNLTEEGYGEKLSEWVVSSEPFASPDNGNLLHFFSKTAQSRGVVGSGKSLVKEARKCHKGIPVPHANSAVYVCFSEERMDLCRAIVTGPVDTPYAHGIFVMDVYFPPTYPQIPPLMQWMTTGIFRSDPYPYRVHFVVFSQLCS